MLDVVELSKKKTQEHRDYNIQGPYLKVIGYGFHRTTGEKNKNITYVSPAPQTKSKISKFFYGTIQRAISIIYSQDNFCNFHIFGSGV